ncbi:MAG TPA: Nramp family divalent metal transporter [Woeseiaceae bacterium]|nr:Nramp family divalent metal transporter [Woeseiaceae bacterium]
MPGLLRRLRDRTGPGLLFAASSVGVSHLVQSTRAGAEYGLTFIALIVVVCLVKYPVYLFGSTYAAATGNSLVDSYRKQGRWAIVIFTVALLIDMFVATAAVSLVTAGLIKNLMHIEAGAQAVAIMLLLACGTLLIVGRYRLFESLSKLFVVLFCVLTVAAALVSTSLLDFSAHDYFPVFTADRPSILFAIAVAGWMPTSVAASVFLSVWVKARAETSRGRLTPKEALFDFNLGYFSTMALALCFLLLGTALLYGANIGIAQTTTGFAAQVIEMFTSVFGAWTFTGVAALASIVMISTLLTLLDGPPRTLAAIIREHGSTQKTIFALTVVQIAGTTSLLLLFITSFTAFVDFATSTAFLTAPVLAYLNHKAVTSGDVAVELRPGRAMRAWSVLGVVFYTVFFAAYLYYRIGAGAA